MARGMSGSLKKKFTWVLALIVLCATSVIDELIAVILLLEIDNGAGFWPSLLFAVTTAGALFSGPISSRLLDGRRELVSLFIYVLLAEAFVTFILAVTNLTSIPIVAVVTSGIMGILGGVLWTVVLLFIAEMFEKSQLDTANKWTTTIRNLGFVAGPTLGGLLYVVGTHYVFWGATILLVLSIVITKTCINPVYSSTEDESSAESPSRRSFISTVRELFTLPGVAVRILPPMLTAFFGSIVNVGLVVYILTVRNEPPAIYGLASASISIGLVLGPFAIGLLAKDRMQPGIGISGIFCGIGIALLFQPGHIPFTLLAGLLMGMGNGGQNTFMSILLMNALPKKRRPALMPAFVFSIHCFVFLSYVAGFFISVNNVVVLMFLGAAITIALGIFSFTRKPILSSSDQ